MKLPEATRDGEVSLEKAILKRRSVREFSDAPLTLAEVTQPDVVEGWRILVTHNRCQ